MKKLFVVCTLFLICISIARIFPCGQKLFEKTEQTSSSPQCSLLTKCSLSAEHSMCSTHLESIFDATLISTTFAYIPSFLGQIFFQHINTEEKNISISLDRPPTMTA